MSILEHLSADPRTKRQIAERAGLPTREVELLIQDARLRGIPICSSDAGYWLAQSAADVELCADRLRRRAANQFVTARALRRAARRMEERRALTLFGDVA